MRCLLQRVQWARVRVQGLTIGEIERGLVALVAVGHQDTPRVATDMARKMAMLRVFADESGKMNRSLLDVGGGALIVSQFTLYADCTRGRRPFFGEAAAPELAEPLCSVVAETLRTLGISVATGKFAASMQVELCNDGPVTIWLDSQDARSTRPS